MDDVFSGTDGTAAETTLTEAEVVEVTEDTVVEAEGSDVTSSENSAVSAEVVSSSEIPEAWMEISDYGKIAVGSIPVGVLSGAIFMIVGLGIWVIVKIFKQV